MYVLIFPSKMYVLILVSYFSLLINKSLNEFVQKHLQFTKVYSILPSTSSVEFNFTFVLLLVSVLLLVFIWFFCWSYVVSLLWQVWGILEFSY